MRWSKCVWGKKICLSQEWPFDLLSLTRWAEQYPNKWCHHFLTGTCEGRSLSHHLLGRKWNISLCSLVYCCQLSSPLIDSSFLLSPGEGSHASHPMEAWGSRLGNHLVSVGIHTEREEWTSKVLAKRKYLWENAIGKLRKHWALFPSGYAFCCFESARLTREIEQKVEIIGKSFSWVFKAFPRTLKKNNKLHLHNAYSSLLNPKLAVQSRREVKY